MGLGHYLPLQVFGVVQLQVYNDDLSQVNDAVKSQVFSDEQLQVLNVCSRNMRYLNGITM
jgi:hypothetical protein